MEKDGWRKKVKAECGYVCRFAVGFFIFIILGNGKRETATKIIEH